MVRVLRKKFAIILLINSVSMSAIGAVYYPNGSVIALAHAVELSNDSLEDDIIDLGDFIYNFDGVTPPLYGDPGSGYIALETIINSGKLSIINGNIRRSFASGRSTLGLSLPARTLTLPFLISPWKTDRLPMNFLAEEPFIRVVHQLLSSIAPSLIAKHCFMAVVSKIKADR